jgi:hypothetical protein
MQKERRPISAGELYVMLDREFRLRQSTKCGSCYILLPFRVDQHDHSKANWEIVMPPDCPYGCARIVERIVEDYAERYELGPDLTG